MTLTNAYLTSSLPQPEHSCYGRIFCGQIKELARKECPACQQQMTCWNCGSADLELGGNDDLGNPITVCADCHNRQEEE